MKQKLDIETWARRDHFNFFKTFSEPYHGVCVTVDCTGAYHKAKEQNFSFFLYCVYQVLVATNQTAPFKYRIENGEVFIYDRIDASATIGRDDGTFGFSYINYEPELQKFMALAAAEVQRVKNNSGLELSSALNFIQISALPWVDFTSLSHARSFSYPDSCPKVSFGKMTEKAGKRTMPVSIHVHHALADGLHVGQFIDRFTELMSPL